MKSVGAERMTQGLPAQRSAADEHREYPEYRNLGLWLDRLPASLAPRPSLPGDTDADVAIVGAGFTGLWTAYYLKRTDPALRIVVVEKDVAGFGASGRNGGWCSDLFPASWTTIGRANGRDAALAMKSAMRDSIEAVADAVRVEAIDCDFHRGGTLAFARSLVQLDRARSAVTASREWGDSADDFRMLDADEVAELTGVSGTLGASFTPHCAAIDPAKLVRGLADRVSAAGVDLHELTEATEIRPHRVVTDHGTVRADVVVRATEAYTSALPGSRRDLAPVYSLIVATEPLSDDLLDRVGLADRQTFTDHRHLITYGQRTADGRLVFGGRGTPYHYGSRIRASFDRDPAVFASLERTLVHLFPALSGVRFTHRWGGPLGVARDWHAGVGLDVRSGFAWAGGYVGDGVATSNLAGRTLADLITRTDTDVVHLPWVGHRSRRWEPEPLRYLGINAGLKVMTAADAGEARTGRSSQTARLFGRMLGG